MKVCQGLLFFQPLQNLPDSLCQDAVQDYLQENWIGNAALKQNRGTHDTRLAWDWAKPFTGDGGKLHLKLFKCFASTL